MILLLLLNLVWAYQSNVCPATLNVTKLDLIDSHRGLIPLNQKIKIRMVSKTSDAFELRLYGSDGHALLFKGSDLSATGIFTYYEVKNIEATHNKILVEIWLIKKDYLKIGIGLFALVTIVILIVFKRDHYVSQAALIVLLLFEAINTTEYEKISDKVIKKYLF